MSPRKQGAQEDRPADAPEEDERVDVKEDLSSETVEVDQQDVTLVEESEQVVDQPPMGFEDTVSLSTDGFPALQDPHSPPAEPRDVLSNRMAAPETSTGPSASDVEGMGGAEDNAVTRRSLMETPAEQGRPATPPQPEKPMDFENAVLNETSVLEGATVLPMVPSRAGAGWLSAILTLLLSPIAWYLLTDAGARFVFTDSNPMLTGVINPAALAEFAAGLLIVILMSLLAAQSSLGLILSGSMLLILGVPFLAAPAWVTSLFDYLAPVEEFNAFGANVVSHLAFTGFTGILAAVGFAMIAAGWVVASVRRAGRREEALRVEVLKVNPQGMKARWARKATARQTR